MPKRQRRAIILSSAPAAPPSDTRALSGVAASSSLGTLVASGGTASRALTGVAASGARGTVTASGGDAGATLTKADFESLGGFILSQTYHYEMSGAFGFYLRREPLDTTQPLHFGMSGMVLKAISGGRVKLEMRGSLIKVWVDEGSGYGTKPMIQVVDPSISSAGRAGLLLGPNASVPAGYYVDDFSATNAGGGAFVTDALNDTDGVLLEAHSGALGASWAIHPSFTNTGQFKDNVVVTTPGVDGTSYYASGVPASADYDVEAYIGYVDGTSYAGVIGRLDPATLTMYIALYYAPGKQWVLSKYVAGEFDNVVVAPSPKGAIGIMAGVWENRWRAPEIPANPTLSASYNYAELIKDWGPIAGQPFPSNRYTLGSSGGALLPVESANGQAGTTPWFQLGWDHVNDHLFWMGCDTYYSVINEWFGYSELDWVTGEVTNHGPFAHNDTTLHKGSMSGIFNLPASFVASAGLGAKRMASCGSTYASTAASGDTSPGPQITAFVPPADISAPDGTNDLPAIRMAGYAPWAQDPTPGFVRLYHPAGLEWYEGEAHHNVLPVNGWPANVWEHSFADITYGGVMIKGAAKSGFVSIQTLNKGCVNYCAAQVIPEMRRICLSVTPEADMIAVVNGDIEPHEASCNTEDFTFELIDPADATSTNPWFSIDTITATAGQTCEYSDGTGIHQGAFITTSAPHGLTIGTGSALGVQGSTNDQYNGIWSYLVESTTVIRIWNNSLASHMSYDGVTGTGGHTFTVGHGGPGSGPKILGLQYDEVDQVLYLGFMHKDGTPMVWAWQCHCD